MRNCDRFGKSEIWSAEIPGTRRCAAGDIPKCGLSSVAPDSNGTIAVMCSRFSTSNSRMRVNFRFQRIFCQNAVDYISDIMQSANATETRDESQKIVGFALEGKYRAAAVRRGLDLLFYVNLGMQTAWGIEDGARPGVQALVAQGWRSVSFLHGIGTSDIDAAQNPELALGPDTNVVKLFKNLAGEVTAATQDLPDEQGKNLNDSAGVLIQCAKYMHGVGSLRLVRALRYCSLPVLAVRYGSTQ